MQTLGTIALMDALRAGLCSMSKLNSATPAYSVFAFAEFAAQLQSLSAESLLRVGHLQPLVERLANRLSLWHIFAPCRR